MRQIVKLVSATQLSEGPGASAPTLVFLHGFMGGPADYAPMIERLGRRYRCIGVELAGHGKTPLPDTSISLRQLARPLREDVLAPLGRPTLVGYSMGGRLALQCALDYPESVANLVLISTSPGIEDAAQRELRRAQDALRATRICQEFDAFLADWYRLPIFGGLRNTSGFEAMLARRKAQNPAAIARVITELSPGLQPSNWPRLDALRGDAPKTTWLVGADDPKYHQLGQKLAALDHQVRTAAHAAHALHIERPEWCAQQIEMLVES